MRDYLGATFNGRPLRNDFTTYAKGDPLPHVSDAVILDALAGRCFIGSARGIRHREVVERSARLRGLWG